MAYTTPNTWATSTLITAAKLNQDLRDNVSFLATPPSCRAFNNANQSISNNALTTVTYNSERFDTDTMHSTSVNTGRITFTTAGKYLVGFNIQWTTATDYTELLAQIRLNGATVIASTRDRNPGSTSDVREQSLVTYYSFSAADYVELTVRQQNGATAARNILVANNYTPEFWAVWQSL